MNLGLQGISDWLSSSLSAVKSKEKGMIEMVLPLPL